MDAGCLWFVDSVPNLRSEAADMDDVTDVGYCILEYLIMANS